MTSKNFFYFSEFFLLHPLPSQNLYFFHLSVFHGYFLYQLYLIREVLLYRCLPRPLYHLALKNFFPSLDLSLFPDLSFWTIGFVSYIFLSLFVPLYFGISKLFQAASYIPRQIPIIITDFSRNKRFYPIETQLPKILSRILLQLNRIDTPPEQKEPVITAN